jgi:hypothetical protein
MEFFFWSLFQKNLLPPLFALKNIGDRFVSIYRTAWCNVPESSYPHLVLEVTGFHYIPCYFTLGKAEETEIIGNDVSLRDATC